MCSACEDELEPLTGPLCRQCGRPWGDRGACPLCRGAFSALQGLRAGFFFEGPLREAIHRFKYRGARALAVPLATLLLPSFDALPWTIEALAPVPLYTGRERQRGYNQAVLLAAELARHRSLDLVSGALFRIRDTRPQMGLDAAERRANVARAFAGKPGALAGKRVLLIDDVCTTGSTLEACAAAALEAGASAVCGLVLARAK